MSKMLQFSWADSQTQLSIFRTVKPPPHLNNSSNQDNQSMTAWQPYYPMYFPGYGYPYAYAAASQSEPTAQPDLKATTSKRDDIKQHA